MSTISPPFQAIPTIYNGIQLRSRLEAQAAYLFDVLGWKWEYEPESIMLPCGTAYTPDFWLPEFRCVVECRGYDYDRRAAQESVVRFGREYSRVKSIVGENYDLESLYVDIE